jgi:Arc/MetJ-type ribon-helix-helix transcriptional regulator
MQIALSESQEEFVKQAVSEGRFASEAEVLDAGFGLVRARGQKLDELRAMTMLHSLRVGRLLQK